MHLHSTEGHDLFIVYTSSPCNSWDADKRRYNLGPEVIGHVWMVYVSVSDGICLDGGVSLHLRACLGNGGFKWMEED
jgi:hypothetical protein